MPKETIDITPDVKAVKRLALELAKEEENRSVALSMCAVLEASGDAPTFAEFCEAAGIAA